MAKALMRRFYPPPPCGEGPGVRVQGPLTPVPLPQGGQGGVQFVLAPRLQRIDRKLIRVRRDCVFADHAVAEIPRYRRPRPQHRRQIGHGQPIVVPRPGRLVGPMQQGQRRGRILHDRLMQIMGEVEIGVRIVGRQRRAGERLDLLAVRGGPLDDGRLVRRQIRVAERQEQGLRQPDLLEQKRRLRMKRAARAGECLHVRAGQALGDFQATAEVPQLRFDRQQFVLAVEIGAAANFQQRFVAGLGRAASRSSASRPGMSRASVSSASPVAMRFSGVRPVDRGQIGDRRRARRNRADGSSTG